MAENVENNYQEMPALLLIVIVTFLNKSCMVYMYAYGPISLYGKRLNIRVTFNISYFLCFIYPRPRMTSSQCFCTDFSDQDFFTYLRVLYDWQSLLYEISVLLQGDICIYISFIISLMDFCKYFMLYTFQVYQILYNV